MTGIILHGTLGNPQGNWFPWLARELQQRGHVTLRPQLPTPDGQTPEAWRQLIADTVRAVGGPDESILLIAHSMSCLSVCQYLATIATPVRACFFVAGFAERLPDLPEPYPTLNDPFTDVMFDWEAVRKHSRSFTCFAGDNDPYVPLEIGKRFAAALGTVPVIIPGGRHLSAEAGFREFPQLLTAILGSI